MIQHEETLISLVRIRNYLVKTITYNLRTSITNYAEAYLNS